MIYGNREDQLSQSHLCYICYLEGMHCNGYEKVTITVTDILASVVSKLSG